MHCAPKLFVLGTGTTRNRGGGCSREIPDTDFVGPLVWDLGCTCDEDSRSGVPALGRTWILGLVA
jgi:hypothetical protein